MCSCPGDCEGAPECLDDEGGPLPGAFPALPGLPRFAVVEIEWDDNGEPRKRKFGPWLTSADGAHSWVISGFVCGWSAGSGIEPARATIAVGDDSIAEGAVYPYRDQPGKLKP